MLGVLVVLGLPLLIPLLRLSETQYGILAGMTVYAVPQVLAATVPAGIVSTQIGTLVKLIRVMMLGPLVACIAVSATKPACAIDRLQARGGPSFFTDRAVVHRGFLRAGDVPLAVAVA